MIALQGSSDFRSDVSIAAANIPALYRLSPAAAQSIADDLANVTQLSYPAVIVEDTHPAPVSWPTGIRTILAVRPTEMANMRLLNYRHGQRYASIVVCDHPASPTWPFDAGETEEILSWQGWECIGPVFRTTTRDAITRVRARHRIHDGEKIYVFAMGAGGEQRGSGDRVRFIEDANRLAPAIQERLGSARLLFVRGPLFPREIQLPDIFEDIAEEPDLVSLIALAHGAVIRPSFNTTWECIAGRTPFIALPGTTFAEPVTRRLSTLGAHGLDTSENVDRLVDEVASRQFAAACNPILEQFNGAPKQKFLRVLDGDRFDRRLLTNTSSDPCHTSSIQRNRLLPELSHLKDTIRRSTNMVALFIRIDDLTALDSELISFLTCCMSLRLFASLEIIPYHNTIGGLEIDRVDTEGRIEIGQHGYAHLPSLGEGAIRGEFISAQSAPVASTQLRSGLRQLARCFGARFRGGYSAPYDVPSTWLASAWEEAGGSYLSWIRKEPKPSSLPTVRVSVDPWDWGRGAAVSFGVLCSTLAASISRDGTAGLVLHPQCLRNETHRQEIVFLLEEMIDAGCCASPLKPNPDA